ncbi:MAG: phospho-sugar mutase [Patescibacteria group bacterium]|jgi:phosphomannomutase
MAEELQILGGAREHLSSEALVNLERWLTDPAFAEFVPAIKELIAEGDWKAIEDHFYMHIMVGTGGIRGTLGVGPNRMNRRTISEAAQGLSQFIHDFGEDAVAKGVVIGYEVRRQAREFAELSAEVFAANGIRAYLFPHLCSTPEVSFAIRHLSTTAGVMITASHNPRTDNGFKFYWADGGQVVPPLDLKFMDLVNNVERITHMTAADARDKGLLHDVSTETDEAYIVAVRGLSMNSSRSAHIVYSPMHGAGSTNVLPVLTQEGFHLSVVEAQREPDENFSTATSDLINPEFDEVIAMALQQAEQQGSDIAIVSDPDADRLGVATKMTMDGTAMLHLNGNEVGTALVHYLLTELKQKGMLTPAHLVVETNVTSTLISDIAKAFNVRIEDDLLVGFKFIGEIIEKLENKDTFVIGAEESLGYLVGTFVRDKDASIAALLLCELVSVLRDQGKTLAQYLDEIYQEYGYYKTVLKYMEMKGKEGFKRKEKIMLGLRANPPKKIAGYPVLKIVDRLPEEQRTKEKYNVGRTGDQIAFVLSEDGRNRVTVRPSGTEPMVKCYFQYFSSIEGTLEETRARIDAEVDRMVKEILAYNNAQGEA